MMKIEKNDNSGLSQSQIFLSSEADHWYLRNKEKLEVIKQSIATDILLKTCKPYSDQIKNVLEIGCASAQKLEIITREFEATGYGIDPSELAINDARSRFSAMGLNATFSVGVSSDLPYLEKSMDLVLLGFFLYVVGRNELESTINEINRVTKPGGFLLIEDFDYGMPITKEYVHHRDLRTYKENYARYFIDDFGYYLIEKHSYSHSNNAFHMDPDERVSTQILFKSM